MHLEGSAQHEDQANQQSMPRKNQRPHESDRTADGGGVARAGRRLSQASGSRRSRTKRLPVIVLGIGKERYGIDLPDVAEVLPPVRATPVPGAAAVFAGVINVHGEIRPVIDLRRLLGMERSGGWRSRRE
jgi:hypothetical protein